MTPAPEISAVVTVYNKAPCLADTIRSLRRQADDETKIEYIFVDDASTDDSLAVIRERMAGAPSTHIVENADNRGPSVRLNQGAAAARGDFLYFLDADDIATDGAMQGMLGLLQRENADMIYGKTLKRPPDDADLFAVTADANAPNLVSNTPLRTVLGGGFVRMALMCRRELFMKAGGADERIFVQDESLPLRLAARAERLIDWQATVIAMPPPSEGAAKISQNRTQLHHDAFLAYSHALDDLGDEFPDLKPLLYAKAVSAYWKFARSKRALSLLQPDFWRYLNTKTGRSTPRPAVLARMRRELEALPNIRRVV